MATIKKIKRAQTGVTTKKGRTTINVTDTSGYAAGKKAGYPAQMISPKTKYSKGDTTNVTVNRKMVKSAIKKNKTGGKIRKAQTGETVKEKPELMDRIFGTAESRAANKLKRQERRADNKIDRENNRLERQANRQANRGERQSRRSCARGSCGGRALGFSGYNKNGGKTTKKK